MAITPNSNFTTPAFKMMCRFVLPLVYDDELSYYEAICKLREKVNEVIENNNNITEDVKNLYEYVNHYFDNLDVRQEIEDEFNKLVSDGTFEEMINQDIFGELNTKVDKNTQDIATANQNISNNTANITKANQAIAKNTSDITIANQAIAKNTNDITTANQKITDNAGKVESVTDVVSGAGLTGSCIIIADSYGGKRDGVTNSFLDLLNINLQALGYEVTTKYIDGGGMSSSGSQNFLNLLQSISSPQYVDFILVCGGVNDANRDYATNAEAIHNFVTYAATRCKQLFLCFSSWVYAYGLWEKGAEAFRAWSECSQTWVNAYFINGLQVMERYESFISDLNHPTQTANNYLYSTIIGYLRNKMSTYVTNWRGVSLANSGGTTSISGAFSQKMINNTVCMRWSLLTFKGIYNNFYTSGANYEIELASYTPAILMPTNSSTFIICQPGTYTTSTGQKNCIAMLYFTPDGKLMCGIHSVEAQASENAIQIDVFPGQITYNNLMY